MKSNAVITIVGQKGSGKSYLARSMLAAWRRVVTVDWLGEYPGTVIMQGSALAGFLSENLERESFRASFRPESDADLDVGLTAIHRAGHPTFKTLAVLEEAGAYAPPTVARDHPVIRLFRFGRHARIDIIAISQRPADLSRMVTAQSDCIIAFRTQEPRDIDYLKSYFQDRSEHLPRLDVGEFITWGDTGVLPPYIHTKAALTLERERASVDVSDSRADGENREGDRADGGHGGDDGGSSEGSSTAERAEP